MRYKMRGDTLMERWERLAVIMALQECEGNKSHAAKLLGISVRGMRNKLRKYSLQAQFGGKL